MEFKQLESFAAVVKFQSFTRAAEHLYISQPTISTHIRMLEEEFQSRFIVRTTKNIEITPRGWELYEFASQMLIQRDNLLRHWTTENQREIRLGASTIPSAYILPEILPRYRKNHPQVQFHIHQSDSQGVVDGLMNGSFELGLVGMTLPGEGIVFVPFCEDSIVLITPAADKYRVYKAYDSLPIKELLREPFIMREQGSGSKKCAESYFEHMGIAENDLQIIARLNDQESIKNLVAGGLGVSMISRTAARNCDENKILTFELPGHAAARSLYLAWRRDFVLKENTRNFIDFVTAYYQKTVN